MYTNVIHATQKQRTCRVMIRKAEHKNGMQASRQCPFCTDVCPGQSKYCGSHTCKLLRDKRYTEKSRRRAKERLAQERERLHKTQCVLYCVDLAGVELVFNAQEMQQHLLSQDHVDLRSSFKDARWIGAYGRQPLSPVGERSLFTNLTPADAEVLSNITRQPFTYGLTGCEQIVTKLELDWAKTLGNFADGAVFTAVYFSSSVSAILRTLAPLLVGLKQGSTASRFTNFDAAESNILVIEGSYAASPLFHTQSPMSVTIISIKDLKKDLDAALSNVNRTVVCVIFDVMAYTTFEIRSRRVYKTIRDWCSTNHVPMVCDETLSFLSCGTTSLFAYIPVMSEQPDFVILGKFTGLSALVATSMAPLIAGSSMNEIDRGNKFAAYIGWVINLATVRVEILALWRSKVLLQWALTSNLLKRATAMTDYVPGIFIEHDCPPPTRGCGFMWYFSDEAVTAMKHQEHSKLIHKKLTYANKMYLHLDTTPNHLSLMLQFAKVAPRTPGTRTSKRERNPTTDADVRR
jgi:hypothetical protein